MNHFRVIVRTPGGEMIRMISTPTDYLSASQLARGLRHCGEPCVEIVTSDRQWGRQAAELASMYGSTFTLFPGNAPAAGVKDQGACDGKNEK